MSTSSTPESDGALVLRRLVGGTVGGVLQAATSHPFDTVKSRVQQGMYPTALECARKTFAKEGFRGFYKGVTPPLILSGFNNSILFSLNQAMMNVVTPADHDRSKTLPLWRTAIASQMTAPLYVVVITPMEVVKVKLQVQPAEPDKKLYSGPVDCIMKTMRKEGPTGLLRGYLPTVGSRLVGLPFYFGAYQVTKEKLTPPGTTSLPMHVPMLSGMMAGLCFWSSNYPLDLLKTLVQASSGKDTMGSLATRIYKESGLRGFYRGFAPCLIRSVPANASVWIGVEKTTQFMKSRGY